MTRLPITLAVLAGALALAACKSAGMGAETRADIAAQMKSAEDPIQTCYADALQKNRRLKGVLSFRIVAAASTGQFSVVNVPRDEPRDAGLTRCIAGEISKLKLANPTSSSVQVDQPIRLMPNN